jgi:uncharacterized membrane protein
MATWRSDGCVTAGIAWIGSSYIRLADNHGKPPRAGLGRARSVHGGFYHNQKYQVAPSPVRISCTGSNGRPISLDQRLSLLVLIYYVGAEAI